MLSDPDLEVAVVGSRPDRDRPIASILRFVAVNALIVAGLAVTGLGTESAARLRDLGVAVAPQVMPVSTPITAPKPAAGRWLELESSPFLEVGRRTDGSIDMSATLAGWHKAGLTEKDAVDVLERLAPLAPTILAVDDPAFERVLQDEATQAAAELASDYPLAHARLTEQAWEADAPGAQDLRAVQEWTYARHLWQRLGGQGTEGAGFVDFDGMEAARTALAKTAGEVGLRALRVPVTGMTSSWALTMLSDDLHAANRDLQKVTGWTQGVLGLGGRVELNTGHAHGAEGSTTNSWSGRLQMTSPRSALSHEWLHALDFTLAHYALATSTSRTLSSQEGPLRVHAANSVATDWSGARESMEAASPLWQSARSSKFLSPYWQNNSEEMAYALQAQVHQVGTTLHLASPLEKYNKTHPHAYPSPAETAAQAPLWNDLFAKLAPLGLSATPLAPLREAAPATGITVEQAMAQIKEMEAQMLAASKAAAEAPPIGGRIAARQAAEAAARRDVPAAPKVSTVRAP